MHTNTVRLRTDVEKELEAITQQNPTSKLKICQELQTGLRIQRNQTSHEIANIIDSGYAYRAATMGVIRKALASFGVALSNLAQRTIQDRLEVSASTAYVRVFIDKHYEKAKAKARTEADLLPTAVNLPPPPTLPPIHLNTIGFHQCWCAGCAPDFMEDLRGYAGEEASRSLCSTRVRDLVNNCVMREKKRGIFRLFICLLCFGKEFVFLF